MSNDRTAAPAPRGASIKVPDQLQQSNRPGAPPQQEPRSARQDGRDKPASGILHELKTERAHD